MFSICKSAIPCEFGGTVTISKPRYAVLIGSTHPGYTAVDYPGLALASEEVRCWPCHLKVCPLEFRCMRALTGERVASEAAALVERMALAS